LYALPLDTELPPSFGENNPVSQDSTVEIVYTVTSSNAGAFSFDEFNWVGYYQDASVGMRSAFGYSENDDQQTIRFFSCAGDFDGDGDVDGSDLAVFAADFGRTNCDQGEACEGDFEPDGDVDGSDLATFAADFGRTNCP
jgi:hypothetical protein